MSRRLVRAVFGGSFDPVHYGHLAVAETLRRLEGFDRVVFVPAGRSPHKHGTAADAPARLAMLRLVLRDNPAFEISTLEIARRGPSYTIDTVRALAARWGERPPLLLGGDALLELHLWREAEALRREARLVVYARPGFEAAAARARAWGLPYHEVALASLSSSAVRTLVANGISPRYLVPDSVRRYIERHGLYGWPRRRRA